LDQLDDADLADDPGDGIDEYWRLRTSLSEALAEIGQAAVGPLVEALRSTNPRTRAYAARALGMTGARQAYEPIVALLTDEVDDIDRVQFIDALGELGDPRAIDVLLRYLKTPQQVHRGWLVRVAANALGKIGTEAVIDPLAEVLGTDADWFARLGAAEGLCRIQSPRAADVLRKALHDEDVRVRAAAEAGMCDKLGR